MKVEPEALVILIHIILVVVYAIIILLGRSQLRKEYIIPLCLIPIFGILFALTVELILLTGRQGIKKPDIEGQGLGDDILWVTLKSFHEKSDLVPLEEAVLIDEVNIRRKSMLETLYTDPSRYLGVLNTAKYSADIEISHYATTTIAKAQKEFQLAIQKNAVEMERHPSDAKVVDVYIDILGRYIQSGLLEEGLLRNIRMEYARALDKKLAIAQDDQEALVEKLRNAIELHDYNSASETSRLLRELWPTDEQTWIETLRVCVEGKDEVELRKTIDEIQRQDIIWTQQGREQIKPWMQKATP